MFKKLISGSVVLLAVPVAAVNLKDNNTSKDPFKCRPSELPIYPLMKTDNKVIATITPASESLVRSSIENGVRIVRETCCECVSTLKNKKKPIDEFVSTGVAHSQFIFDYLNEPANGIHRTGAVAVGAISGYIIAIRRGFLRKLFYTSLGGVGVASICYPKQAEHYWQQTLIESKTYATIVYNFAYGVKPGDEPKPLPNIMPENLKEAYGSVVKFFKSEKK